MGNKIQVQADIPQTVNYQTCTVNVGSTTTLESNQNATVTNSGTQYNAVFNFGIPKGKSAYEQAVAGGYSGTEADFNAALASDITTVATNISNVNTVGADIANVNTVAGDLTNVDTVAGISSDVQTVATNATDVTTVASISSAVQNVAGNESNVTLVADNLANVNTVASNMNSVLTTAADIANINTVAGDTTNIDAVASNSTNINAVAGNETNINAVNANKTNIDAVAGNKTNIDTVAGISSDVSTVAGIYQDVSTVAEASTDVSTVASNVSDVSTVATNISNVNSAVSNMAAIIAAPTAATNAANSATNAQKWAEGLDSDVTPLGGTHSAKGWANRAEQIVASLGPVMKYKGTVATYNDLPSTGQEIGDTYNILDTGENYAWDGSDWDALSSTVDLSAYRTSAAQDVIDAGKAPNTNKVNGIPLSTQNAYYYAESTSAADAVQKEVSIPAITELNAGQVIIVKPTVTSTVANSTLKLNSFTAYPMLYGGSNITTSTDSKVWSAYIPSIFVFDGSYWRFAGHGADDNTTYTLNYLIFAGTANAGVGTYAVTRYALLMQKLDGTWESLKETSTNYSTGTTKTVNTSGFIPGKITYYNTTTVKKNGEAISVSSLYLKATTVDARYSFNCGATPGWAAGDSIYVVGTIGTDGLFYLDSTTWWSNALPTTQDGKVYMYIGTYVSDAYKISLDLDHPMYYYDGTSVKPYVVAGNKLDVAEKGVAGGLATLDANAKVPVAQLPDNVYMEENLLPNSPVQFNKSVLPDCYTVVGSPTITDGILSGLSASNYLKIDPYIPAGDMEFQFAFNVGTLETNCCACEFPGIFSVFIHSGSIKVWNFKYSSFPEIISSSNVSANDDFVIKFVRTGTSYTYSWARNGGSFSTPASLDLSQTQTGWAAIGAPTTDLSRYFRGTIDLNNTYIKVNGQYFVPPSGKTIVSVSTMTGADGVNAGIAGLVPAPTSTDNNKFLKGDGTWATAGGGSSRNVGEIVESTVPLTDAGLHLLDGSLLSGSGSYADFVTHMAGVYTDHPELFTTEANWQTSVTDYGVCGKFVYTAAAGDDPATVRLPKKASSERRLIRTITSGSLWCDIYSDGWCEQGGVYHGTFATGYQFQLLTPFVDTDYEVITNSIRNNNTSSCYAAKEKTTTYFTGEAFRGGDGGINLQELDWTAYGYVDVSDYGIDIIYQYIVTANSTKTEIEVDIDEITTDLNGKADVDLSNVSNTSGFRKLIEVYNNGTSWYKVYNEYDPSTGTFIGKWCEQGGRTTYSTTGTETVSLLKEMRDTNYSCQVTLFGGTSGYTSGIQGQYLTCWDLTTTSFKHQRFNAQTVQQMWKVCGYLA